MYNKYEVIVVATANVQVRMDADLKRTTEETLKSMGLTMSSAITMFCRQVVNQGRIPFEIIAGHTPTEETRKAMEDTLAGKNLSRPFDTVDEMWEDLNAHLSGAEERTGSRCAAHGNA